jgi:hypothetical protein
MAKREILEVRSAWRVWVGDKMSVVIDTEEQAAKFLSEHGEEYTGKKDSPPDVANSIRLVLWSDPLPEGETYHKAIPDAVMMILYKGQARKILPRMTPSRLKRMPPDWADLYRAADADDDVLSIKPKIPLIKQLEARWPNQDA